jgi:hypothetical protein
MSGGDVRPGSAADRLCLSVFVTYLAAGVVLVKRIGLSCCALRCTEATRAGATLCRSRLER